MFPRAANADPVAEAPASEVQAGPIEAPARPTTAWANPITFTSAAKHANDETDVGAGETEVTKSDTAAPKSETKTRAEQAIAFLREKGPLSSKDLCEAMGIDPHVGISPYVAQAVKNGSIRRDNGRYFLPDQEASLVAQKKSPAKDAAPAPAKPAAVKKASKPAEAAVKPGSDAVDPIDTDVKPYPRVADFTLGIGGVVLIRWLNGSVTLQRRGMEFELTRDEARLLTMYVDLCK